MLCPILLVVIYGLIRYHAKILRLKHLFAHHRLHEQISLEINSNTTHYTHLPTSEQQNQSHRSFDDVLADEVDLYRPELAMSDINHRSDEFVDDPFYVDEKQPIFSGTRSNTRTNTTGIL
jgi:hypothetical protein